MRKGWAKGLTAETDARVARAAEGHRGLRYVRRKAPEECKWSGGSFTALPIEWSVPMAYVVGLIATDGCLLTNRRQINFKSLDRQLVETYLGILGRSNRIRAERTRAGRVAYVVQFADAKLYHWLLSVGLTPRKSLTLGPISVPDRYLLPLARGLLDGDGTIMNKTALADTSRRSDYYWECLVVKFSSASRSHLAWLSERLHKLVGVEGYLSEIRRPDRNPFFQLRYGKRASLLLLPQLYPPEAPCLERKRQIWLDYQVRHMSAAVQ